MDSVVRDNVFCNKQNQVEMVFSGYLDNKTLLDMLHKTDDAIQQMEEKKIRAQLLVDVTGLNRLTSLSRRTGTNWIISHKDLNIAVYGKNVFMKHFVNFLIIATGRNGTMKFFNTRKDALLWLNSLRT